MIDYRETLEKYVRHVIDCESIDYIPVNEHVNRGLFTEEELAVLRHMADKKYAELYPHLR